MSRNDDNDYEYRDSRNPRDSRSKPSFDPSDLTPGQVAKLAVAGTGLLALGGVALWLKKNYVVLSPHQVLVKTGFLVKDMEIARQTLRLPFQVVNVIDLSSSQINFKIHAMSKEMLKVEIPGTITMCVEDDPESIKKYSSRLLTESGSQIQNTITSIVEGEVRSVASQMTMIDIFSGRETFRDVIGKTVGDELRDKFGLVVQNATISELADVKGSTFFHDMSQRATQQALQQARIDTAEAESRGLAIETEKRAEARMKVAQLNAEAQLKENEQKVRVAISTADLDKKNVGLKFLVEQETVRQKAETDQIAAQLATEVQKKVQSQKLEEKRAQDLTQVIIQNEIKLQKAKTDAETQKVAADIGFYEVQKKAESAQLTAEREAEGRLYSTTKDAEGRLYSATKDAEGKLVLATKDAEGVAKRYLADAEGLEQLRTTGLNGNPHDLIHYLMATNGTLIALAAKQAEAIQGLKPEIKVWQTGENAGNDPLNAIRGLAQGLPSILDAVEGQTGYKLPEWIVKKTDDTKK